VGNVSLEVLLPGSRENKELCVSSEVFPARKQSTLCRIFHDVIGDPDNEIINLKPLNFGGAQELSPQEALVADYKKQLMSRSF